MGPPRGAAAKARETALLARVRQGTGRQETDRDRQRE